MTSPSRHVLYVGVTSDLERRVAQHVAGAGGRFSKRYQLQILVWYEAHGDILSAIAREKQLKAGSRARKIELIEAMNPTWRHLAEDWQVRG